MVRIARDGDKLLQMLTILHSLNSSLLHHTKLKETYARQCKFAITKACVDITH